MQLAEYMEAHGLTDAAMAKRIKKSRVSIGRYRRGLELPASNTVKLIVKVTKGIVTANELLGIRCGAAE